jgi:hypothetical protein
MTTTNTYDAARTAPQFVAFPDQAGADASLESWSGEIFFNASEVDVDRFEQDVFVTSVHDLSRFVSLTESGSDVTQELAQTHLNALIESSECEEEGEIDVSSILVQVESKACEKTQASDLGKRVRRRFAARRPLARTEVKRSENHQDFSRIAPAAEQADSDSDGGVWWSVGMDANAMIRLG